jgi:acetyl-CoA C-acetyltransferase
MTARLNGVSSEIEIINPKGGVIMQEVVIAGGARTPIGAFGGSLKEVPLVSLGAEVIRTTLNRCRLRPVTSEAVLGSGPDRIRTDTMIELEKKYHDYDESFQPVQIDQVLFGNVLSTGQGQNVTRQTMIMAGVPKEASATTVNKLCASGMEAVALGAQAIMCGAADVVLAGGMESMSRVPYALAGARWGQRMGHGELTDLLLYDGLLEYFYDYHMGMTAENIARRYEISRREQDELGVLSHQRARAAMAAGLFDDEIVPIMVPQRKGDPVVFSTDERPMDTSIEKMAKLRPAFTKDGTVTAGNASGINDAAAVVLLMSAAKAKELGLAPPVKISGFSSAGLDPAYMGLGPIPAVRKLLSAQHMDIADFGAIELNEAFAVQALACIRELGCDMEKTNMVGSGISLGHPIGCTGARILVSLMYQMQRQELEHGLATLCIGGGQGMAMALKRVGA